MLFQIVHRQRPLQRQVVQIVVKAEADIAPGGGHRQLLMPLAGAMHHGIAVRPHPVDDAVVDELAGVVQHAGIDRLAGRDLFRVTGGGAVDHMAGGMASDVHLFQARHIHQPRLGADRHVFGVRVALGIGPGGSHPAPVLKIRAKCAVAIRQRREAPGIGHLRSPMKFVLCANSQAIPARKQ